MHIGKTNPKKSYYMRGNILEEVDQKKDLGIIISSDLKCSQQCLYTCNRANKVSGMIRRTILTRIMMSLYKTLVKPHVEYCSSAWSPCYKKDNELIKRFSTDLQKRYYGTELFKTFKGLCQVRIDELSMLDKNTKGITV